MVLISVRDCVDPAAVVRSEGLVQWKFPTNPSGIETATFRLVAQYFKQLRHPVPLHLNAVSRNCSCLVHPLSSCQQSSCRNTNRSSYNDREVRQTDRQTDSCSVPVLRHDGNRPVMANVCIREKRVVTAVNVTSACWHVSYCHCIHLKVQIWTKLMWSLKLGKKTVRLQYNTNRLVTLKSNYRSFCVRSY
jgi:hypothetical protein